MKRYLQKHEIMPCGYGHLLLSYIDSAPGEAFDNRAVSGSRNGNFDDKIGGQLVAAFILYSTVNVEFIYHRDLLRIM